MRQGSGDNDGQDQAAAETLMMVELVAGGIAHDFNNLLQTIQARIELARRTAGDERQLHHLDGALRCAREAQALTVRLRLLARGGAPQRSRVDLEAVAEQALARCLEASPVTHSLTVADDARTAFLDAAQLGQVFDNLLHNARQAMPTGGHVEIHIDRAVVAPDAPEGLPASEYIRIRVADDGPGIPAELRECIFEPDFTTKAQGSGIGLAICQGVARRHGGHLSCASEGGKGTTFTLLLPPDGSDSTPPVQSP